MAEKTLPHDQVVWILHEIASRANQVLELNRYLDSGANMETMTLADADKLKTIAFMGWLADYGLTRMGSCMREHDADPVKWLLCPSASEALAK